ncbi:MAG TPA: formyltransferase family protein [Candidatus Tumulicola sp.]|nr:formyltransferase family protein [Candidatus Tumulicola sp.]
MNPVREAVPTAVLVSGNGTNLQSVIEDVRAGIVPLELRLVVSNNPQAFAIERARRAGIAVELMPFDRSAQTRSGYARALADLLKARGIRLVLLLGWMHVLASEFLDAGFDGVLNLHPAYLPDDPSDDTVTLPDGTRSPVFRGAHALRDALAAKLPMTGATLMQITAAVDRGPVVARRACPLNAHDDEAAALERLHAVEREVVREGVQAWLAQHPECSVPSEARKNS